MSIFSSHAVQHAAVAMIIGLIFAGLGASAMAWAQESRAIWVELRLADFVSCFGS